MKEDRDVLELLFEVVAEKFVTNRADGSPSNDNEKILSITYFINKLFNTSETLEINEIDTVLQNLKATLIYKGLDFSIVFAEADSVDEGRKRGTKTTEEGADRKK